MTERRVPAVNHAKRFCILTTERTGSTSLGDALAAWDDVVVPGKLVPSVDNELLHPDFVGTSGALASSAGNGSADRS